MDQMNIDRCGHDPSHSPHYLGNIMLMNFPLRLHLDIKAIWVINTGDFSGCEFRIS